MNITRENTGDLKAVLKVQVDKSDFQDKAEKVLRDYRKKAAIKGFRPGMVPIEIIRKMYGKAVQADELNKLLTESIQKYLTDEKIEILGDPLPETDDEQHIDFDTQDSFTFSFELGLSPSFDVTLSKKNKVKYYEIEVDDKMKDEYLQNYRRRYGKFNKVSISEEKDMMRGRIEALADDNNPVPDGVFADDTTLSIDVIKDEEIKKAFIGKSEGDTIDFDLRKAFPNDYEISALLKRQREEVGGINGNFRFTVNEISRFSEAEINSELFDKIYGEGIITTESEFLKKIEDEIADNLKKESEYKLSLDLKELAIEKTEFSLPEDFLKKWLLKVNENTTVEQIEKEFESFKHDLKWELIRNRIARQNDMKISEEELLKEAENITRYQFRQYGLFYAEDEQITNYAKETLRRKEDAKRIAEKILEDKVISFIKELVKIENKTVTIDGFNKLFE